MKTNRILSTAGVCPTNSTKLRSYCNLMQGSLNDKWLFADDFVESHVCFIRDDYLINMNEEKMSMSQVVVVINKANRELDDKYQIKLPLTAAKIKDVLNRISHEVEFQPLSLTKAKPKTAVNRFKTAFSKIRKNFFGKNGKKMVEIKKQNRDLFISKLTKKINLNDTPAYKIVLLGSPGSGKTTAIEAVSEGKALNSDVSATDSVASNKVKTTVGIDYAEIVIANDPRSHKQKLTLFGTPGQIKFNFIWDIVGKNADAFIILLDMSRPEPLSYLRFYNRFLHNELGKVSQIYCALTHCENYAGDVSTIIDCIASEFSSLKGIYRIDAREKDDITIILSDIYPQIEKEKKKAIFDKTNRSALSMLRR